MRISEISEYRCRLGEGPLWDPAKAQLYWLDSLAPALYRYAYANGETIRYPLPGTTAGSLALRERGGLVLAMDHGFYFFDPASGDLKLIAEPLAGHGELRFNDGKVDPFGAFVAGAMHVDQRETVDGPMFRLTPQLGVSEKLRGFQCFNGPCFSADGTRLYVTGRSLETIEVFDYGAPGQPQNGRVLIADINPDGATVDAEEFIWSAQWDDQCLLRVSPAGEIDLRLPLPGRVVTSVMFGGPELDILYVTTLGDTLHGVTPLGENAGRTLAIEGSGFRGRPEPCFRG